MNAIDLTSLEAVKNWLGLVAVVDTNSGTAPISPGSQTVTPSSMVGIVANTLLSIDTGVSQEVVQVVSITATTFTATFALSHISGAPIVLAADVLIPSLITAGSLFVMQRTGIGLPPGGGLPTQSPFTSICSFNEWYDGSGTERQFVRNPPIVTVTMLTIQGTTVMASSGPTNPGYVIDDSGSSIALIGGRFSNNSWYPGGAWGGGGYASGYFFASGIHNINIQYTAGYSMTPYDLQQACNELVGHTFRKRQWIGQKSQTLAAGGGTTAYVDWAVEPIVEQVIRSYTRKALV